MLWRGWLGQVRLAINTLLVKRGTVEKIRGRHAPKGWERENMVEFVVRRVHRSWLAIFHGWQTCIRRTGIGKLASGERS